jgi:hypothetical protein
MYPMCMFTYIHTYRHVYTNIGLYTKRNYVNLVPRLLCRKGYLQWPLLTSRLSRFINKPILIHNNSVLNEIPVYSVLNSGYYP